MVDCSARCFARFPRKIPSCASAKSHFTALRSKDVATCVHDVTVCGKPQTVTVLEGKEQTTMGQIYIEDYVVSFLKQKKTEATESPIKLALYGTTCKPKTLYQIDDDSESAHYIYGAAVLSEDRTIEEIGDEYFKAFQFLGFVNVHNCGGESISKYQIFYDENTAMQDYLLFYYMSPFSNFRGPSDSPFCTMPEVHAAETDKSLKIVKIKKNLGKSGRKSLLLNKLKLFILGLLCLMFATSISTIDDYGKISDFIETTKIAIDFEK